MKLEPIIGLEFHVQLKTKTKMFCCCANNSNEKKPNTNVCPICLAHPGTLPKVNEQAVKLAIKTALALNFTINQTTKFDRKNYFYPDLPKGYQISQFDLPLAENGVFTINYKNPDGLSGRLDNEEELKQIRLIRLHLEEDSGKSIHAKDSSLIDFNRGGAPLIEIVTFPDFRSPSEAKTFAQELRLLLRHLGVSGADMEKGELRCDANVSLRPQKSNELFPKTEIKNINSFKALEKAIAFEIKRQTILWEKNDAPKTSETRGWNDKNGETVSQRSKEENNDYRYFPEPDLPAIKISNEEITEIKNLQPELPQEKRRRFMSEYEFNGDDAKILTEEKKLAAFVEAVISELGEWLTTLEETEGDAETIWQENKKKIIKLVGNWLINKLLPELNNQNEKIENSKVSAENFAEFITLVYLKKTNQNNALEILQEMVKTGADPSSIIEENKTKKTTNSFDLTLLIEKIIKNYPDQVAEYRNGKEPLIKFFLGLVMRESKGQAEPIETEKFLKQKLQK
ncbi:MAG: Asp-tRNA(Asn)/Glu-tRNA(Gln) amidotransferase subunit GatB [Patescibacteria group bacterium]